MENRKFAWCVIKCKLQQEETKHALAETCCRLCVVPILSHSALSVVEMGRALESKTAQKNEKIRSKGIVRKCSPFYFVQNEERSRTAWAS